jgi:hypothetical protein
MAEVAPARPGYRADPELVDLAPGESFESLLRLSPPDDDCRRGDLRFALVDLHDDWKGLAS